MKCVLKDNSNTGGFLEFEKIYEIVGILDDQFLIINKNSIRTFNRADFEILDHSVGVNWASYNNKKKYFTKGWSVEYVVDQFNFYGDLFFINNLRILEGIMLWEDNKNIEMMDYFNSITGKVDDFKFKDSSK